MLTKERTILEPFAREPWKIFTFKEIKKLSHNSSDNYVHTTLKRFVASRILQEQKIGNNVVYYVTGDVFSLTTIGFVVEYTANTAHPLPHKNIQKIINKLK